MLPQLATLYFVARQVGHKRGNTSNSVFQLAMQQCCETSWRKMLPVLPDLYKLISEICRYVHLYNNPSYSRILIGSRLWSIRGQMHDWRHHYKVFPSAVLKWRKVLRIRIIFYVTGQKIKYKKVLPRHWTGSRSQKTKDKAVSFRKWYRNNF